MSEKVEDGDVLLKGSRISDSFSWLTVYLFDFENNYILYKLKGA